LPTGTDLYALLAPVIAPHQIELYDVEILTEHGRKVLRLYIDKPGGVTLDDCENITYAVQPTLDADDPIPGAYVLEVSSPGIERKLIKDAHYTANIGKLVEVKVTKPVLEDSNQKKFRGTLTAITDSAVLVDDIPIPRDILVYCRLIFVDL